MLQWQLHRVQDLLPDLLQTSDILPANVGDLSSHTHINTHINNDPQCFCQNYQNQLMAPLVPRLLKPGPPAASPRQH